MTRTGLVIYLIGQTAKLVWHNVTTLCDSIFFYLALINRWKLSLLLSTVLCSCNRSVTLSVKTLHCFLFCIKALNWMTELHLDPIKVKYDLTHRQVMRTALSWSKMSPKRRVFSQLDRLETLFRNKGAFHLEICEHNNRTLKWN